MPEIKNQFTSGKMNKDLDERLVPNGEYRDAMNIQVSTSEGSDVGTIQNILGNTGIDPSSSGSLTNSIVLDDTSLYSNITQGMFATGYNGPNTAWGPTLVNNVGIINTIPVNYQSETITTTVNSSPITDTAWINVRTFYELGCTGGSPSFNINRKNPCSPNQSQVSSTNIPPNTYGAQLWIHPSDWNPNIVVGSKVSATNLTNGLACLIRLRQARR
jgi:hypothetical protein